MYTSGQLGSFEKSCTCLFFFLQIRKYVVEYLLILIISIVTCYIFICDSFISWFCSDATPVLDMQSMPLLIKFVTGNTVHDVVTVL